MPYQKLAESARPLYVRGLPHSRVLRQYARMNQLANYAGSAYRFPDVEKLQLLFKAHSAYGHMGARKFWRNNLPTINFHNPEVAIEVKRIECETKEQQLKCPSVLKVILKSGQTKQIDCKNRQHDEIMNELVDIAQGVAVPQSEIPVLES